MAVDYDLHTKLALTFGAWSSTRVSRFLGVNARTVQRWLKDGKGTIGSEDMPADLREKVADQFKLVEAEQPLETIEDYINECRQKGIHEEVLASHLAILYRRLLGTDIE